MWGEWQGRTALASAVILPVGPSGPDRPDHSLNGCLCFRKDGDALRRSKRSKRAGSSFPKKDARTLEKVAELSMENHGAAGRHSLPFFMTADALELHS